MKDDYNPTGQYSSPVDSSAKREAMPASTASFQNKVRGSSYVGDKTPNTADQGAPKDGGITGPIPIAQRRIPVSDPASPDWPANKGGGGFTYHGKGK